MMYQKGEANGSRTFLQQVVLKPHEQANVFIQSSGATVKAVTASQVEYMLLNHSNEKVRPQTFRMKTVLFRGKPTRWKPHNNKQTREKSQVMKDERMCKSTTAIINFKAAALTAYLSTLDLRKELICGPFSFGLKGLYLRHPLDFDLRRYAVPPRLKEMLLSLENRHCMSLL
jgi:hypothetical protein